MDSKSMLADAYCEIRFGPDFHFKTSIARKTLNPVWNNASFRIEVPSSRYAQDNIMEIRVWDYDLVRSSDDLIGSIFIDPNVFDDIVDEMQGWLPLFDSLNGIRGELYVVVKFQILENLNPFRDSSALVTFYSHGSQELLERQLAFELQQQQQDQFQNVDALHTAHSDGSKRRMRLSPDDVYNALPDDLASLSISEERKLASSSSSSSSPSSDSDIITHKYVIETLVEELLMEEDPEHEFLESLRSNRVTNSRRQQLLFQLSGKVRRMMGKRAEEMRGDVICGYQENFDLEDDNIIVRAIGTICRRQQVVISRRASVDTNDDSTSTSDISPLPSPKFGSLQRNRRFNSSAGDVLPKFGSPKATPSYIAGSLPRDISLSVSIGTLELSPKKAPLESSSHRHLPPLHLHAHDTDSDNLGSEDVSESNTIDFQSSIATSADDVTLITMTSFEPRMIVTLGAAITVRSVKHVLDMKLAMLVEQRDEWWKEIRDEVRSHAHSMRCTHVLGYNEITTIYKDLCILSATGTAAVLNNSLYDAILRDDVRMMIPARVVKHRRHACKNNCSIFHAQYALDQDSPYSSTQLAKCQMCGQHSVPEIILSSLEIPEEAPIVPESKRLIEARVCKHKRKKQGEGNAKIVSEIMPFVDYELHKQLLLKMKLYSLNACFNLQYDICVSDTKIVVIVTGTGCFSQALPPPGSLHFLRSLTVFDEEDKKMFAVQNKLRAFSEFNHNHRVMNIEQQQRDPAHQILIASTINANNNGNNTETASDSLSSLTDHRSRATDSSAGGDMKTEFVVEIDDDFDEDQMAALMEPQLPDGLTSFSNLQNAFVQEPILQRCSSFMHTILMQKRFLLNVPPEHTNEHLKSLFDDLYRELAFRCTMFYPCALVGIKNDVKMANDSELLICTRASVIMLPTNANSCDFTQVLLHGEVSDEEKNRRSEQMMLFDKFKMPLLLPMHAPRSPGQQLMNDILERNRLAREQYELEECVSTIDQRTNSVTPLSVSKEKPSMQLDSIPAPASKLMFEMDDDEGDEELLLNHSDHDDSDHSDTQSTTSTSSSSFGSEDDNDEHIQVYMKRIELESKLQPEFDMRWMQKARVVVTSGWNVPGCRVVSVFCRIGQHLVRESDVGYVDNGQTFVQTLLSEAMQIIKAHAAALGANCILNLSVDYHVHDFRKQSYSLLSISGDAAVIEYLLPTACAGDVRISQFSSFD